MKHALGNSHDLCVDRLHKAFLHKGSDTRSAVYRRLEMIQRLRDRIAHHEPIISSN